MQANRIVSRKVDRERITIGSCLAHRFGLRIFVRGVFSKRVRKMLATAFSIFGSFTKFDVFGVQNDEIGVWRCVSAWKIHAVRLHLDTIGKMQSNQTFSRKVDRERITIGSLLAHRFGLRIFARGVFLKRVQKMLATTFSIFWIFMKFEVFGVHNYEIGVWRCVSAWKCGTNPPRYLPGPKTTIKT